MLVDARSNSSSVVYNVENDFITTCASTSTSTEYVDVDTDVVHDAVAMENQD